MKYLYRSFGRDLKTLLSFGDAVEITVPDRATRLLIVNYGMLRKGVTLLTLTDTIRRAEDLRKMTLKDIYFLRTKHHNGQPAFTTTAFECCLGEDVIAEPASFTDHLGNTEEHVFVYNEKWYRAEANPDLRKKMAERTAIQFERLHSLGFFGSHVLKKQRSDLTISRFAVDATLKAEYNESRAVESMYREQFTETMRSPTNS